MLDEVGTWAWFAIGVGLIVLETLAPGVFLFWLGLAAFAVGFVHLALLGLGVVASVPALLVLFAVCAMLAVALGRMLSGRAGSAPFLNQRGASLVGRVAALQTSITGGNGSLCLDDTVWRVAGPDLPAGTMVAVIAVEGTSLRVRVSDTVTVAG